MLFKRSSFSLSVLVVVVLGLTYALFVRVWPVHEKDYRRLAQESLQLRSGPTLEKQPAHQLRTGVQKDIWTLDGRERLHIRLQSAHSQLVLQQKGKKLEAVELLQNLQYWMQEQVDPLLDVQQVRLLSAAEGAYYFPSQRFVTQNVHLAFYRLPGQDLPAHIEAPPFLHGLAQEMWGDLVLGDLHCTAPSGYFVPTPSSDPLCFSAEMLVWEKRAEQISLQGDVSIEQPGKFTVQSDKAILTLQSHASPSLCYFNGHVQLFAEHLEDKPSFALADSLSFSPLDQTLILSSYAPKRTLFWQEGFSLSAPEVHVYKNPLTQKEFIEGKGDVHFSFDSEEKNLIQELLAKYL